MLSDRAILKFVLNSIRNELIYDVGYCFDDDPETIQFCLGAVVCRMNLKDSNCTISVSYRDRIVWGVRQTKICEALREYIRNLDEPLSKVNVPPPIWQEHYWCSDRTFKWHVEQSPLSLKSKLSTLFDPDAYFPFDQIKVGRPFQSPNFYTPSYDEEAHRITQELMLSVVETSKAMME